MLEATPSPDATDSMTRNEYRDTARPRDQRTDDEKNPFKVTPFLSSCLLFGNSFVYLDTFDRETGMLDSGWLFSGQAK